MTTALRSLIALALFAPTLQAADVTLNGRTFHLPDGFTIELVAGPPLVDRPITADFDEQGRLYVADSSGSSAPTQKQLAEKPHRILRLEDTNGDGVFDRQTVFADHMMFPEGTLWYAGSLYVSAAPSIWKLTDTNNDGVADQRSEWFQGKTLTGCANDLHGPYLGPDGWIYWCKGAFAKQTYTLENGKIFTTRASHIFRTRPDNSGIEPVMTGGMDNPVEVVFTPGGERIFTTTFLTQPAAGKRDGLIHAVYGGVYGKVHDVIDDHIRTSPDVMPVLSQLGPAAPCGLVRYESDVFGKQYQDNLFSSSFNLHKVFRHVLTPDGATFKSKDEDFLTSDHLDFHPTHLIEDADGSLVVVDTGGWYKLCCPTSQLGKPDVLGAIYRVRRTDAKKIDDPRGLKIDWSKISADELAKLLDDPRPAVQKRAMAALAASPQSLAAIDKFLESSSSERGRLNAVWTASRIAGPDARATVRSALADKDPIVAQAACHAVSIWRDRVAVPDLLKCLDHPSLQVRRAAAEALGRTGQQQAAPAILLAIEKAAQAKILDRFLEHSLIYALIELGSSQELDADYLNLAKDSAKRAKTRQAALIVLDQTNSPLMEPLPRGDGSITKLIHDPALRDTAAWIFSRRPALGNALAADYRQLLNSGRVTEFASVREQLSALAKSPAIQDLLAEIAGNTQAPRENRQLALAAMGYASIKDPPSSWLQTLATLVADQDWKLAGTAAAVVRKLAPRNPPTELTSALVKLAERSDATTPGRFDALAALPAASAKNAASLPALKTDVFSFVASHLSPETPPQLRLTAAEILGRSRLSREELMGLTAAVESAGPLEIDRLLPAFAQESADDAVAGKLLDALAKSKSVASLRADTLRSTLKRFGPDIQQKVEPLLARVNPDAAAQRARLEQALTSLPAGDIRRGQLIFNSTKAACVSCHTIGYVGGHVGPDLSRIGAIRARRDLLESILFPSASFVQSFEPIIVETTDGDVQSGILRRNDAEEVLIVTGPDKEQHIPRKDVKTMRPGNLSVMPAGLDQQLAPQELSDLVTFLQACK
jgi:putative membrane-bound dehydrogenase-like protein